MASIEPTTVALDAGPVTIRVSADTDAAQILALRVATAGETDFLSCYPEELQASVEEQAAVLRRKLGSSVDLYILAEVNGRIVGLASLDGSPLRRFGHGATLGLAVSREFWNQGIGRALVQRLLEWADARGLVRIALEVLETNLAAIRLYESLGFEYEGRLRSRRKHGDLYLDNHAMSRVRT